MTDQTKCYRCDKPPNTTKKGRPYCWDCLMRSEEIGLIARETYQTVSNWGLSTKGMKGTHSDFKVPREKLKPERNGRKRIPEDCPSCHADWNLPAGWKLEHLVVVKCPNPYCGYAFDSRKAQTNVERWRRTCVAVRLMKNGCDICGTTNSKQIKIPNKPPQPGQYLCKKCRKERQTMQNRIRVAVAEGRMTKEEAEYYREGLSL